MIERLHCTVIWQLYLEILIYICEKKNQFIFIKQKKKKKKKKNVTKIQT